MIRGFTIVLLVLSLLPLVTGMADQATGERLINADEPWFVQNIGPHGERVDNPLAAVVVAIGVAGVIGRGLWKHTQQ